MPKMPVERKSRRQIALEEARKLLETPLADYPDFGDWSDRVFFTNAKMKAVLDNRSDISFAKGICYGLAAADIDERFEYEGLCSVVKALEPETGQRYIEEAIRMSVFFQRNGPVGNGRLHEFVFRARPGVMFDFAQVTATSDLILHPINIDRESGRG